MDNLVGQTLNRYKITAMIGEGGMGAVFKAVDLSLERDVALKIMHPHFARQQDFQQRFLQEARTAARMNHPGIVSVYDFGQDRGRLYIVMKFIAGDNLEQMLDALSEQKRWIPLGEAVGLVRQAALALDYAHRQGVLHRDLKPSNIMLEPEPTDGLPYRPVITDLGLAKLVKSGQVTQDQISMGTPAYMSPEQAMGQRTDARSDIYSLGILLFELATGRTPFNAHSLGEAIKYHAQTPPPSPRSIRPEIPDQLERIILQALEKDPARRYQNAGAMAEALRAAMSAAAEVATPPNGIQQTVSLFTQYQNSLVAPRGVSMFDSGGGMPETMPAPAGPSSQDRIQVRVTDGATYIVPVRSAGMTIGRDPDSEIPVDDPKASRQHARIDFDGQSYRVTDLNSTNGTFIGSNRLIPGVPVGWGSETTLRIGDTYLRLLRPGMPLAGTVAATTFEAPQPQTRPAAPRRDQPPAPTQMGVVPPISMAFTSEMRPRSLQAGQVGRITIRNLGSQTDTYSLSWDLSSDDLEFTPPYMNVNAAPGQEVVVEFRADARRGRMFGGERRYGFNAQIRPSAGQPQVHPGEVLVSSALPAWTIPLLLVLCVVLAGLTAALASSMLNPTGNQTTSRNQTGTAAIRTELANAVLTQTLLGQAVELTRTAESFTATALANANQATVQAATATGNANATLFAATQTGVIVSAQTSVAQTALAQQATFQAGVTQTVAAQQATQAVFATQTAIAGQTLAAGGVQTAAALTAAAGNQQTAQAGTAAAQTAQAGNSLTQTAAAQRRVAYIYSTDSSKANDFRSFLQGNEYRVDLISVDNVLATDFSAYHLILIGAETGNQADPVNNPWGDPGEVQAGTIASFNKPIVGLGRGGALFFQALGLDTGWANTAVDVEDDALAVDPNAVYWRDPNNVGVPGNQIVQLYSGASSVVVVNLPAPVAGVAGIGQMPANNQQFNITLEDDRFLLWGFEDGPADMSNKGQRMFLNILWNLVSP